jgi:hypothetical protein
VVRASDLRDALEQSLDQVELAFGAAVELGADHYLDVHPEFALDMTAEPNDGTLTSQFSDDVTSVYQLLDRPRSDDPAPTCTTWRETGCRVLQQAELPDVDRRCLRTPSRTGRAIRHSSEY